MTSTNTPVVQVEEIRTIDNKGSLKAFASIVIGNGFKINDIRIIEQAGKSAWISLPQRESVGPDGKKKYWPVIELPDHIKQMVEHAVLEAWQQHRKTV